MSFNPEYYGTAGAETFQKMDVLLKKHGLLCTYNTQTKIFTVLESSKILKEKLKKIFEENSYTGWAPEVLDEVDPLGNHLVKLRYLSGACEKDWSGAVAAGRTPDEIKSIPWDNDMFLAVSEPPQSIRAGQRSLAGIAGLLTRF